jgi:hypothetical protein
MIRSGFKHLALIRQRQAIPYACPQAETRVAFSSAQVLPDEKYDEDYEWKPDHSLVEQKLQQRRHNFSPQEHPKSVFLNRDLNKNNFQTSDARNQMNVQEQRPIASMSPHTLRYTGEIDMPITSVLKIIKPGEDTPRGVWPVFRLMVS